MHTTAMTIDGDGVAGDATFEVINRHGGPFERALTAVDPSLTGPSKPPHPRRGHGLGEDLRRAALHRAGELLRAASPELAPMLTSEQGKPIAEAAGEIAPRAAGSTTTPHSGFRASSCKTTTPRAWRSCAARSAS